MKYIVSLIFSIYFSAKHFGQDSVPNFAALAYYLQHTPVDTIGYILGGMLPTILIWVGIAWLIKKLKPQQSMPSVQTPTKQAPQSALSAYTQNTNTQHLATTQEATPFTHSATPSLTMAMSNSQEHSDDDLWEQALNEYDSSARKQGLWARLFSESEGNETLVKANYLRIRVDEMQQSIGLEKERIETERKIAIAHEIAISETKLLEQQAYDALPKGVCPNCKKTLLLLSANKCPKCSALFGPHSAFKISEISKQEQLTVLRLLAQNGNRLTEYEAALITSEQI
jgi:hypothetical protein